MVFTATHSSWLPSIWDGNYMRAEANAYMKGMSAGLLEGEYLPLADHSIDGGSNAVLISGLWEDV